MFVCMLVHCLSRIYLWQLNLAQCLHNGHSGGGTTSSTSRRACWTATGLQFLVDWVSFGVKYIHVLMVCITEASWPRFVFATVEDIVGLRWESPCCASSRGCPLMRPLLGCTKTNWCILDDVFTIYAFRISDWLQCPSEEKHVWGLRMVSEPWQGRRLLGFHCLCLGSWVDLWFFLAFLQTLQITGLWGSRSSSWPTGSTCGIADAETTAAKRWKKLADCSLHWRPLIDVIINIIIMLQTFRHPTTYTVCLYMSVLKTIVIPNQLMCMSFLLPAGFSEVRRHDVLKAWGIAVWPVLELWDMTRLWFDWRFSPNIWKCLVGWRTLFSKGLQTTRWWSAPLATQSSLLPLNWGQGEMRDWMW